MQSGLAGQPWGAIAPVFVVEAGDFRPLVLELGQGAAELSLVLSRPASSRA
jgi:hypothetical protein